MIEKEILKSPSGVSQKSKLSEADTIRVKKITVLTGRLVIEVNIADERLRYTNSSLAEFLRTEFPDLPSHTCVNEVGNTFGCVIDKTSLPHLLEHLTISFLVRSDDAESGEFVGTTEWIDEGQGSARIQISFFDDLVALRAFNNALRFLNNAVLIYLA